MTKYREEPPAATMLFKFINAVQEQRNQRKRHGSSLLTVSV